MTQCSWICLSGFPTKSKEVIQASSESGGAPEHIVSLLWSCRNKQGSDVLFPQPAWFKSNQFSVSVPGELNCLETFRPIFDSHLVTSRLSGDVEKLLAQSGLSTSSLCNKCRLLVWDKRTRLSVNYKFADSCLVFISEGLKVIFIKDGI